MFSAFVMQNAGLGIGICLACRKSMLEHSSQTVYVKLAVAAVSYMKTKLLDVRGSYAQIGQVQGLPDAGSFVAQIHPLTEPTHHPLSLTGLL